MGLGRYVVTHVICTIMKKKKKSCTVVFNFTKSNPYFLQLLFIPSAMLPRLLLPNTFAKIRFFQV